MVVEATALGIFLTVFLVVWQHFAPFRMLPEMGKLWELVPEQFGAVPVLHCIFIFVRTPLSLIPWQ